MNVLVLNPGSASLKFQLIDGGTSLDQFGQKLISGTIQHLGKDSATFSILNGTEAQWEERVSVAGYGGAARYILDWLDEGGARDAGIDSLSAIGLCGLRVVHGGGRFTTAVPIDDGTVAAIEELDELAPLHNARAVSVIRAVQSRAGVRFPLVAVFDTVFHRTLPDHARLYALQRELAERHGIRRYGFHGISHEYMMLRYARITGVPVERTNLITLHLEGGSSATAIRQGRSVDTSMGFTPLEGLVMGTRCGDLDPALVGYLIRKEGVDVDTVERWLNRESGLLGLSGRSQDTRDLVKHVETDRHARLALEIFSYRVRKYVGAYLAALGGADAVVFGGGIGENTSLVRALICEGMQWCGLTLDERRNEAAIDREARISSDESRLHAWVIPAEEGLMIAREAIRCLHQR
jgi:acetate kinase